MKILQLLLCSVLASTASAAPWKVGAVYCNAGPQKALDEPSWRGAQAAVALRNKSLWLESAGYSLEEPEQLAADLRAQLLSLDAQPAGTDNFGDYFETSGPLKGPSGKTLRARAIWMTEHLSGETRLITLLPDKNR
jgi:hypothetical protein